MSSSGGVFFSIKIGIVQLRIHEFSVLLPSLQHTGNTMINCPPGPVDPACPRLKLPSVCSSDQR